jgi:hypothetical protein
VTRSKISKRFASFLNRTLIVVFASQVCFAQTSDRAITEVLIEFGGAAETEAFEVESCIKSILEMRSLSLIGRDDEGKGWAISLPAVAAAMAAGTVTGFTWSKKNFSDAMTASKKSYEEFKAAEAAMTPQAQDAFRAKAHKTYLALAIARRDVALAHDLRLMAELTAKQTSQGLNYRESKALEEVRNRRNWRQPYDWQKHIARQPYVTSAEINAVKLSATKPVDMVAASKKFLQAQQLKLDEAAMAWKPLENVTPSMDAAKRSANQAKTALWKGGVGLAKAALVGGVAFWAVDALLTMPAFEERKSNFTEQDILSTKNPKVLCTAAVNGDASEVRRMVVGWRNSKKKLWLMSPEGDTAAALGEAVKLSK